MHGRQEVFRDLEISGKLPTLPNILLKVMAICDDDEVDLESLARTIESDPALCAETLRLVNSAYYGLQQPVKSIKQGVVYLGHRTIYNMVAVMAIHQVFGDKRYAAPGGIDTGVFWSHSLMCGTIGRRICDSVPGGSRDEVYLAGLLHDVGKLILASTFDSQYEAATASASGGTLLVTREDELFGINHCEVGSRLVRSWKMSSLICDAISCHHFSQEQINQALPPVKIVYVANMLLHNVLSMEEKQELCASLLGLAGEDMERILVESYEEVSHIAGQMSIPFKGVGIGEEDRVVTSGDTEQVQQSPGKDGAAESVQEALLARVEKISLLGPTFDSLLLASDTDTIMGALENSLNLLFGIDKTLFFLPHKNGVLLQARGSTGNPLTGGSRGLTLPTTGDGSVIVSCYRNVEAPIYLKREGEPSHLADAQILNFFDSDCLLLLPLVAEEEPVGVLAVEPGCAEKLPSEDLQLMETVVRQAALRILYENRKAEAAEKLQAEKMAAVSLAARKLAHEINNPLGIISNCLTGIRLMMADQTEIRDELQIIDEEIHRISAMVSQMDSFSQAPFTDFKDTDVNETIKDVVQLCQASFFTAPDKRLTFVPGGGIPRVTTAKDALKQILINLVKNGAEAMDGGGRVVVRTKLAEGGEGGSAIEIIVGDTGPGLPDHVRQNLYQPLVSSKGTGHSGLGLSIVHKAVKDIGASITCTSNESEGTTFTVSVPLSLHKPPRKSRVI